VHAGPFFADKMNVPATNMLAGAQFSVAVTKKVMDSTDDLNRQSLKLIEAASAPKVNASGNAGTRLNVVA
jgi:hypothetical protein